MSNQKTCKYSLLFHEKKKRGGGGGSLKTKRIIIRCSRVAEYVLFCSRSKLYVAEVFSTGAVGRVGARFVSSRNSAVSNHGVFVDSVEAGIALRHHSGWFTDVLTRSRSFTLRRSRESCFQ